MVCSNPHQGSPAVELGEGLQYSRGSRRRIEVHFRARKDRNDKITRPRFADPGPWRAWAPAAPPPFGPRGFRDGAGSVSRRTTTAASEGGPPPEYRAVGARRPLRFNAFQGRDCSPWRTRNAQRRRRGGDFASGHVGAPGRAERTQGRPAPASRRSHAGRRAGGPSASETRRNSTVVRGGFGKGGKFAMWPPGNARQRRAGGKGKRVHVRPDCGTRQINSRRERNCSRSADRREVRRLHTGFPVST